MNERGDAVGAPGGRHHLVAVAASCATKAGRAGVERGEELLVVPAYIVRTTTPMSHARPRGTPHQDQPVNVGEDDIVDHHVELDRGQTRHPPRRTGLADDLEVVVPLEGGPHPVADQVVVIDQRHTLGVIGLVAFVERMLLFQFDLNRTFPRGSDLRTRS